MFHEFIYEFECTKVPDAFVTQWTGFFPICHIRCYLTKKMLHNLICNTCNTDSRLDDYVLYCMFYMLWWLCLRCSIQVFNKQGTVQTLKHNNKYNKIDMLSLL